MLVVPVVHTDLMTVNGKMYYMQKSARIEVRVTPALLEKVKANWQREGESFSQAVRRALEAVSEVMPS